MNGISHKQALQWIDRRLDGLLTEEQVSLLEAHLAFCEACRAHAAEIESLPARLQNEFHARWDEKPGPSQKVMQSVTSQARRIPMANRISSSAKLAAGAFALILLAFMISFVVSRLQNISLAATNGTPTPMNPAQLKIDPQSCKPASQLGSALRPPNELYGYDLIQGTSLVDGEFSYDFWLYCDSFLKEDLSAVNGLGLYVSWNYAGPKIEAPGAWQYEFEPDKPLGGGSWSGPLYSTSITGARFGINIPKTAIQEYIQEETPIQFRASVDSPLGHKGAILSFRLEPTAQGLRIADLHAEAEQLTAVNERSLAFASAMRDNNLEIYTMRPDGSELKNITNNPAHDVNPFWSPDGRRIAFESDRNGFTQIYVMDAGGSNVVQVTGGEIEHHFGNSSPWSPDGNKLLFTEKTSGEGWALYSSGVDGQNKTFLAQVPDIYSTPSWSPDGAHIAFITREPRGDRNLARIHVVDAGGGNPTDATQRLPADEDLISWQYTWSSDGQFISFIAGRTAWDSSAGTSSKYAAYQASLDGETLTQKATSSTPMASWWEGTAFVTGFSPSTLTWLHSDGTYNTFQPLANCSSTENAGFSEKQSANGPLLFSVNCSSEELWFYWANAEGTEVKQLFDFPIPAKGGGVSDFIWSPDDKYAAISVTSSGIDYMYVIDIEATLKDPSRQPVQIALYGDVLSSNLSWQPLP